MKSMRKSKRMKIKKRPKTKVKTKKLRKREKMSSWQNPRTVGQASRQDVNAQRRLRGVSQARLCPQLMKCMPR